MKFLCIPCDEVMAFSERQLPGDGTMAAVFVCGGCGREMAMLTNPMETQLVSSLGVKVGGRAIPEQPMEFTRTGMTDGREHAFAEGPAIESPAAAEPSAGSSPSIPARVGWDEGATDRLARVPSFVRGMVKRIYTDWAQENGIPVMTVEMMDRARTELGLEGM